MESPITLHPITFDELKPLIEYAYFGDEDLINKYQADTSRTYQECVDFNFNEIKELIANKDSPADIFLWSIMKDQYTPIGYCVTIDNGDAPSMLLSYAINKQHRTADNLLSWLQSVEEEIGLPYYTGLWQRNIRAIGFFERNGFERFPSDKEDYVYLVKGSELLTEEMVKGWQ